MYNLHTRYARDHGAHTPNADEVLNGCEAGILQGFYIRFYIILFFYVEFYVFISKTMIALHYT
jgi:hypothetical protein